MFKLHRHEFECPDVVYLRNRQKKINIANIAVWVLGMAGLQVYGWWAEKNEAAKLQAHFAHIPAEEN